MNKKHTYVAIVTMMAVVLSPLVQAVSYPETREDALKQIENVLDEANRKQRSTGDVLQQKQAGLQNAHTAADEMQGIMKKKRDIRMQIAGANKQLEEFEAKYHIKATNTGAVADLIVSQRKKVGLFLEGYIRLMMRRNIRESSKSSILESLVGKSLGERVQEDMQVSALKRARIEMLLALIEVQNLPRELAELRKRHGELLAAYHTSQGNHDQALAQVSLSNAELANIRNIVAQVDVQVSLLQQELARFDAELRREAAKDLIKMGFAVPDSISTASPTFIWPVHGAITAGFYEPSYKRYFGVPHKAIDIRQSQGSPVRAAADGIVFHVQHGGAYGYSYVLVGHRNGYATLYGHLYDIYVSKGQKVKQGGTIGLSGATPGTRGAGPMTTGPHLHFEVIRDGVHMNPLSVL